MRLRSTGLGKTELEAEIADVKRVAKALHSLPHCPHYLLSKEKPQRA
jgi:hypothetical protein